jgi:hypothetical protein
MRCDPRIREPGYRLLFEPLIDGGPAIEFRCNAGGEVDLDALDDAERTAYFSARILRHIHYAPRVIPATRG